MSVASLGRVKEHSGKRRRRRVLLFTNSVMMGGMERHVELLARHLDRASFEVFTTCPSWPPIEIFDTALRQVSDRHVRCTPDRRWGIVRELGEAWSLYRYVRNWHIDVLHMHLTSYKGGWWVVLAARLANVSALVCTEHLAPEEPVHLSRRLMRSLFVMLLDQLICVSDKNRKARARYLCTPPGRTSVVVNGVDPDDFAPVDREVRDQLRNSLGLSASAQIVGTVVRLNPDKGLGYLIDALPLLLEEFPEAHLLVVGDGPCRDDLLAQAARLGVADRVIFAGFHADPRPYLSLMEVFVLPVPVGSMSIGLLEAMAMRRAVIITFGDPGEAVIHEVTGLCAAPRDPASLHQAIARVLRDPELARSLGEAARSHIEKQFSAQGVARRLAATYRLLIGSYGL